jgi:hypothetical protein
MGLADALREDRAGNVAVAAELYEASLEQDGPSLEAMLNLAAIYWLASDPGFIGEHGLTPLFLERAGRRPDLWAVAEARYPDSTEPTFWRRWTASVDDDDEFSNEECAALLRKDPSQLVPVMKLCDESGAYEREAAQLLRQCRLDNTTRSQYVASVIDGVNRRRKGRTRRTWN